MNNTKVQKIVLIIDTSGSMSGKPIEDIKKGLKILVNKINHYKNNNIKVDLHIIAFNDYAKFVSKNNVKYIVANGNTNIESAFRQLSLIYKKNSHFDFSPIVILFCDGQENVGNYKVELAKLYSHKSFRNSLKIAFAYNNQTEETKNTLKDFTGNLKNVFYEDSSKLLSYVIGNSLPKMIVNKTKFKNSNKKIFVKIFTDDIKFCKKLTNKRSKKNVHKKFNQHKKR